MRHFPLAVLLLPLLVGCPSEPLPPVAPELILRGGAIFTGKPGAARQQALAIRNGRVLAAGDDASVLALAGPATKVVNLGGRTVVPGLVDAHTHVAPLGHPSWFLNDASFVERGEGGPTAQEVVNLAAARAAQVPAGTPLLAVVGPTFYATAGDNPRALLDGATRAHPLVAVDWTGHGLSCNSSALAAAGYVDGQQDPYGGRLSRAADGTLTGYVQELAEVAVFRFLASLLPTEAYVVAYEGYARQALQLGFTTVVDIPFVLSGERAAEVLGAQRTPLRFLPVCLVDAAGKVCPAGPDGVVRRKVFLDGGPSDCSTRVSVPYLAPEECPAAAPGWQGLQDLSGAELRAVLEDTQARGGQLLVHALGDAAVAQLFDAMEAVAPGASWQGKVSLEHGDMVRPQDIARAARLGVPVVQNPLHLASVPALLRLRYQPELLEEAQPLRSLLNAGLTLAFGTDAFGAPSSPWLEMLLATTHPSRPQEAISREEALVAYTRTSAAVRSIPDAGCLTPGAEASLAVLSQDVLAVEPAQLPATRSVLTVVSGKVAWSDGTLVPPEG